MTTTIIRSYKESVGFAAARASLSAWLFLTFVPVATCEALKINGSISLRDGRSSDKTRQMV